MSIRFGLLALLNAGPRYGAQLRAEFEARTGGTWPLNIGQVYTTLARLERDGLISPVHEAEARQQPYALTDAGRRELAGWFERPVDRDQPARDELAIKLAMAVGTPGLDVSALIGTQREHTRRAVREYTRLRARALANEPDSPDDVAWLLALDRLILAAEAEDRWLDGCESRLARLASHRPG
ncbi:PadR family transcriptional regulator [Streptomyces sp. B6B3]|uniref:PadR family transcriptional regulator n=1 Tax=Streptomyces sp. B6B3 TaxID=3153570 RepID=UPI00325F06CE